MPVYIGDYEAFKEAHTRRNVFVETLAHFLTADQELKRELAQSQRKMEERYGKQECATTTGIEWEELRCAAGISGEPSRAEVIEKLKELLMIL